MARKNFVEQFKMLDAADISTNQTSELTNVLKLDQASIILEWSGSSPVGTVTVEARNGSDGNFYELDMGSTISISGNSGNHQLLFSEMPFSDIRLQYTSTSGTGSLTATITSKTVGA